ncbi:hypothetical protein OOT00_09260 [Desulfobotulus sp. H1]|uniref:Uncharacterized protein n=1 Tax=Desulfobotulus pelophilus TaxID=2823377 RepID=A0ABT3N9N8_9BACT|nr:hypothetical protein [Desulfobotulus pelophilus]MCW7754176.1 hypothetical protein [Desulfobotulus pelophilus]
MPESCRCLASEKSLEAPAIHPREIFYAFTAFALDALVRESSGPFVLRRVKTDREVITDLPDKQEMKVLCTLTKEQASDM